MKLSIEYLRHLKLAENPIHFSYKIDVHTEAFWLHFKYVTWIYYRPIYIFLFVSRACPIQCFSCWWPWIMDWWNDRRVTSSYELYPSSENFYLFSDIFISQHVKLFLSRNLLYHIQGFLSSRLVNFFPIVVHWTKIPTVLH